MNDFYYSQKDGLAFWVSGYAKDAGSAQEIIDWHLKNCNKFAAMAGVPPESRANGFYLSFPAIQVHASVLRQSGSMPGGGL